MVIGSISLPLPCDSVYYSAPIYKQYTNLGSVYYPYYVNESSFSYNHPEVHTHTHTHTSLAYCSDHTRAAFWDFPFGPVVKNLPANAGNTGLIPGLG